MSNTEKEANLLFHLNHHNVKDQLCVAQKMKMPHDKERSRANARG